MACLVLSSVNDFMGAGPGRGEAGGTLEKTGDSHAEQSHEVQAEIKPRSVFTAPWSVKGTQLSQSGRPEPIGDEKLSPFANRLTLNHTSASGKAGRSILRSRPRGL